MDLYCYACVLAAELEPTSLAELACDKVSTAMRI